MTSLNDVMNDATTNRDVPTAFEPHSSGYHKCWTAFEVNSFNMGIDSGNNPDAFDVHFGSFETLSGHSDRIRNGLQCRFSLE